MLGFMRRKFNVRLKMIFHVVFLVENHPIPMKRIGVRDTFTESGPYLALLEKYGMSAVHIAGAVKEVLESRLHRSR